jgi:SAM-dependent methyltransferase
MFTGKLSAIEIKYPTKNGSHIYCKGKRVKSKSSWVATKYLHKNGKLKASRNTAEVSVGSRLVADLIGQFYNKHVKHHATGRLVDLGCGKVPLFGTYRAYVSDVTCVDWAEPVDGENHLDFICDLSKPLPFREGEFHTIILSDVLEHIADPELLWSEMARILSPGGKLIMNTPFIYCLHDQPHDYYRFSKYALRRFAELNGFDVVYLEPLGGTPEILADIFCKHIQFVPLVGKLLAQALQEITFWFVQSKPGASLSRRTSEAFPLGYAMIAERVGHGSD